MNKDIRFKYGIAGLLIQLNCSVGPAGGTTSWDVRAASPVVRYGIDGGLWASWEVLCMEIRCGKAEK